MKSSLVPESIRRFLFISLLFLLSSLVFTLSAADNHLSMKKKKTTPFHVYFDLLLHSRPGSTPWTFDNYHSVLVLSIAPSKQMRFSAEVNPNPRFYELEFKPFPRLAFYGGKYVIPFGEPNPHHRLGGYVYTTRTAPPNAPPFLPDIWADLGLGLKTLLYKSSGFTLVGYLYTANGFQNNGTDPVGEIASYPNFSTSGFMDNNTDKALGGRIKTRFGPSLSAGISLFTCRYTADTESSKRIVMLGLDSLIQFTRSTSLLLEYIFSKVSLPLPASFPDFQRGALHGELKHYFARSWYGALHGGMIQTDDRVTDAGDQNVAGLRLGYFTGVLDTSLQYLYDFKNAPTKNTYSYLALRFSVQL